MSYKNEPEDLDKGDVVMERVLGMKIHPDVGYLGKFGMSYKIRLSAG